MIYLNFNPDEDTINVIENLVTKFLVKYFGYDQNKISDVINKFYEIKSKEISTEDKEEILDLLFHHDHPYFVAAHIHYINDDLLKKQFSNVVNWLNRDGVFQIPSDAIQDYKSWQENYTSDSL